MSWITSYNNPFWIQFPFAIELDWFHGRHEEKLILDVKQRNLDLVHTLSYDNIT